MGKNALGGKVDFILNFCAMVLAVIAVTWVASAFGGFPSYSLFAAPFIAKIFSNLGRIKNARVGLSQARVSMGEEDVANRERSVEMEISSFWSDLLGLIVGVIYLSPMPLIH